MTILDNSTLAALAECQTKATVRYLLGMVPTKAKAEDAPKLAGKAVHAGLAHYFRGGSIEEAMRVIEVMYRPFADREVPQDDKRMLWPNVERCARSWFDRHSLSVLPFEPVVELIEVPFAVQIDEDFYLTGLVDGIGKDKVDGRYYVIENKTTGQKADWWMRQWRLASQVSHYTYCAPRAKKVLEVLGEIEVAGTYIVKVDMSMLPSDPHRKCTGNNGHGVTFAECGHLHAQHMIQGFKRSSVELETWLRTMLRLRDRWEALVHGIGDIKDVVVAGVPQEGLFNGGCIFCDFQDFCSTGRKNLLMLREEPWPPIQLTATAAA